MKQSDIFYVYILFRPWNGIPFYVGKGQRQRFTIHERKAEKHPNKHLANIIKKAKSLKLAVPKVIIQSGLSETTSFKIEIAFIAAIGRGKNGPLVNLTDGGEGASGSVRSKKTKKQMSQSMMGNKNPLGSRRSEETLAKLREINSNRSKETLAKMSKSQRKRKPPSKETRKRMSLAKKNKPLSKEHRRNIGEGNRGGKRSVATRKRMRIAQRKIATKMRKISKAHWADPEFRSKTIAAQLQYHQSKRDT